MSTNGPFTLSKESTLKEILAANKASTESLKTSKPEILEIAAKGQSPHTLWIGCSDSRVNECTTLGCFPGEVFTLRNIANVVTAGDLSCMSAIQFAIESLKVKRVVVCGHTDCGGVWGSLADRKSGGPLDSWLLPIREIRYEHLEELNKIGSDQERNRKLSELNVLHSVDVIRKHPSFVKAHRDDKVEVYGVIYDVKTGLIRELVSPEGTA
ncbi:hypothetical protein FOA43_003266 [Brettanomyces nanus]|uniref:Carbonic anhydrase n=1 Tax=Eeniella nana TaxID=13502 RepID=A0A875RQ48_EENNA|nr:uncharacterized protein FOA43_003266 [Brettanomyces nanus]QPG75880.1 hypothetical protein FOA43_003266 [Brettanomyces nanus]